MAERRNMAQIGAEQRTAADWKEKFSKANEGLSWGDPQIKSVDIGPAPPAQRDLNFRGGGMVKAGSPTRCKQAKGSKQISCT